MMPRKVTLMFDLEMTLIQSWANRINNPDES